MLVGEGETECNYLTGLREEVRNSEDGTPKRLRIKVENAGGHSALHVVETIIALRESESATGATFIAVFDTEWGNEHHIERQTLLQRALTLAEKNDIQCVLSHPSFEVWLFCHLQCFEVRGFGTAKKVLQLVRTKWKEEGLCSTSYEKGKEKLYEQAKRWQDRAMDNALVLRKAHPASKGVCAETDAFTDMHRLVRHLLKGDALADTSFGKQK